MAKRPPEPISCLASQTEDSFPYGAYIKTMKGISKIGLLAGGGDLPVIFADEAKKKGIKVVVFAAKDIARPELESHADRTYWMEFNEVSRLPLLFLSNMIRHVVLLGKVPKSLFFKKPPVEGKDIDGVLRGPQGAADDSALRRAAARIERFGVRVIDPSRILSDLLPEAGLFTKRGPTKAEREDVEFGRRLSKALGSLDVGQTVVVQNKAILAVEAIEGTDEAIRRSGEYSKGGQVVVKTRKPSQDTRFDIPTVGMNTVDKMAEAGAAVLAIEAKRTFFIDRDECINKADRNGICILAF